MRKLFMSIVLINCMSFMPAQAIDSISGSIPTEIPKTEEQQTPNKESDEALKQQLKNLVGSVHHFRDSMHSIAYEMTRQQYATVMEPEVIGLMVIPAMPSVAFGGYLPPRKKYMDFFSRQSADLLTMALEEGSTLPSGDGVAQNLAQDLSTIKSDLGQLRGLYTPLQKAITAPSYDTLAIDKPLIALSEQVDALCNLLHKVLKLTDKDIKHGDEGTH